MVLSRNRQHGTRGEPLSEDDEWMNELVERWTEVYKKSATSVILLQLVDEHGPIDATQLRAAYIERSGWTVTERGLYRTLQRLSNDGLIQAAEVDAARTGAKRNEFTLTDAGRFFLQRVRANYVPLDPGSST